MRVRQKPETAPVRPGDLTQRVGVEQLVARGVDVPGLIEKLLAAAADEFTASYLYLGLRLQLAGNETQKSACEAARRSTHANFEAAATRASELGAKLPTDVRAFADGETDLWAVAPAQANGDGPDPAPSAAAILHVLLEIERAGIRTWSEIADLTFGKDLRTHATAARILDDKVAHELWFMELLALERDGERVASGHLIPPIEGSA
jgi:ferritin-like protein